MNSVFTLYCCGTAYDYSNGDLIAKLYDATSGILSVDKAIMAGPGSAAFSSHYYDPLPIPNQQESSLVERGGNALTSVVMAPLNTGVTKVSLATGHQMSGNVKRFMAAIDRQVVRPETINMMGWSRGAVTCHKIANALYRKYGESIRVNIFAIDPVPGASNFTDDETSIPSNVGEYVSVMMLNENRNIMTAADLSVSRNTRAAHHVFPGVHSTPVEGGPQRYCAGVLDVVRHVAEEFLTRHGTSLATRKTLGAADLCERFSEMLLNWPRFTQLGAAARLAANTTGYRNLRSQLSSGNYFINRLHEASFKEAYPELYERLPELLGERETFRVTSPQEGLRRRYDRLPELLRQAGEHTRATFESFAKLREGASVIDVMRPTIQSTSLHQTVVRKLKTD